jgi:hypothetical protein
MAIRKFVKMDVSADFYDKVLQPQRAKYSKMLGVNLTNTKFTQFLANHQVVFKLPKQVTVSPIKRNKKNIWSI